MGIPSDHEIIDMIGASDPVYLNSLSPSIEECCQLGIFSQAQALEYIGHRVKLAKMKSVNALPGAKLRTWKEEARDMLANVVLAHVPVENLNFRFKALYVALMIRRVIQAMNKIVDIDDRDYVGNKRLEL